MFIINEDKSIYLTRGDVAFFSVSVKSDTGEVRKFQPGEVVRFKVYGKKNCENVVLQKDFGIEEETEKATIYLEEKDTKIGGVISKPATYWYEVELNPYTNPQTIIGYDDDGAKVFMLYPEGNEAEDNDPITPEDIPVVDAELSLTSTRPVQNQAIARAIATIKQDVNTEVSQKLSQELARVDALIGGESGRLNYSEDYELTVAYDSGSGKQFDGVYGGRVLSNGAGAVLVFNLVNFVLYPREGKTILQGILDRHAPLYEEEKMFPPDSKYPNLKVRIGGDCVSIYNTSDETIYIESDETFVFHYETRKWCIPELIDARFGTDGESYATLGNALRGETDKALAKCLAILNGIGGNQSITPISVEVGLGRVISNGINAVLELTPYGLQIPKSGKVTICKRLPVDFYPLRNDQIVFALDHRYPDLDVIFNGAEIIISNANPTTEYNLGSETYYISYALAKPNIIEIS